MGWFGSKDLTESILDKYYDEELAIAGAGMDYPSKRELKRLAERLGMRFPDEFIAHSRSPLGGIHIEVVEEVWPRPQLRSRPLLVFPLWPTLLRLRPRDPRLHELGDGSERDP